MLCKLYELHQVCRSSIIDCVQVCRLGKVALAGSNRTAAFEPKDKACGMCLVARDAPAGSNWPAGCESSKTKLVE